MQDDGPITEPVASRGGDRGGRPATDVVAGRYALCDPLDAGGSGTVWRAFDLQRGRYCAAKLLRRREAGQLLRFVREQQVRLTGEHIASPYAWAAEESDVLIATELVDGGSAHRLVVDHGPLAESTVAAILDQLLVGLTAVHAAGLVHRDVKPGNLLLRATGDGPLHVLLIDFGLAISAADARLTELGTVIGTPGYLPPELAREGTGPSPAQDLFAAGRTAAMLLTGREPRLGREHPVEIADPVLASTVRRLVDPDPAARPPSAAAARDLLAAAPRDPRPRTADGRPIHLASRLPALPPGWDPQTGPGSRAHLASPAAVLAARGGTPAPTRLEAQHLVAGPAGVAGGAGAAAERSPLRVGAPAGPRRWASALVAAGALAVLVAGVLAVLLLRGGADGAPSGPPGSSGAAATLPVGPTAGAECDWSQQGERRAGPGGAVSCALVDGVYRWTAAG